MVEKFRMLCYLVWVVVEPVMLVILFWFCLKVLKKLDLMIELLQVSCK